LDVPPEARGLRARLDRGAFGSILQNLLSNAVKFTEEGGVTVHVLRHEGRAQVAVEDTGIGISDAFLEQLFNPFRQESTGLSRSHEGNGLGLTIARQLVERMDGEIEV